MKYDYKIIVFAQKIKRLFCFIEESRQHDRRIKKLDINASDDTVPLVKNNIRTWQSSYNLGGQGLTFLKKVIKIIFRKVNRQKIIHRILGYK